MKLVCKAFVAGVLAGTTFAATPVIANAESAGGPSEVTSASYNWTESQTSPKGGYGQTIFDNYSSSERAIEVCDSGYPDGLRVIGILVSGGIRKEIHNSAGAGTCETQWVSGLTAGRSYTLQTCLRNGQNGANVYCGSSKNGIVD